MVDESYEVSQAKVSSLTFIFFQNATTLGHASPQAACRDTRLIAFNEREDCNVVANPDAQQGRGERYSHHHHHRRPHQHRGRPHGQARLRKVRGVLAARVS